MDQRNIRILNILSIELALRKNQRVKPTIKISKKKTRLLARKIEVIHHQKTNYSNLVKRIVSKIDRCTNQSRVHNILEMYVKWKEEKIVHEEEVPSPPYEQIEKHDTNDEQQRPQHQCDTMHSDMEVVAVSDESEEEYEPPTLSKPDMAEEVLITVTTGSYRKFHAE